MTTLRFPHSSSMSTSLGKSSRFPLSSISTPSKVQFFVYCTNFPDHYNCLYIQKKINKFGIVENITMENIPILSDHENVVLILRNT